jgi:excisionase family DNA binding protein
VTTNPAIIELYNEYLQDTGGDNAAAASLTLADVLLGQGCLTPLEPAPMPDDTLTVAEAAKRLKVAPNTVYDLVARGELRHHRIGRTIRILAADIDLYQKQGTDAARRRVQKGKYTFDL